MFRKLRRSKGWVAARWRGENVWKFSRKYPLKRILQSTNVRALCRILAFSLYPN
jgi:hypothetical protein